MAYRLSCPTPRGGPSAELVMPLVHNPPLLHPPRALPTIVQRPLSHSKTLVSLRLLRLQQFPQKPPSENPSPTTRSLTPTSSFPSCFYKKKNEGSNCYKHVWYGGSAYSRCHQSGRCPGKGEVVFLCREEGNSYPSTSDRHNPLTFFINPFFLSGQASTCAGPNLL